MQRIATPASGSVEHEERKNPGAAEFGEDFETEIRIEQSIHLVGQLPTLVVGNCVGVLIGFLLTVDHHSWLRLSMWLFIVLLTVPMVLNWLKLRDSPRPKRVSRRRIRIAAWYSLLLGLSWVAVIPIFLPGMPQINQAGILYGIIILSAGAVASISALPLSALAYLVPMMTGVLAVALPFGSMPYQPIAVLSGLLFIALPGFLKQNWNTFRRNVAIAVERTHLAEMQLKEVERRAAAEKELLAAMGVAERSAEEVRKARARLQSIIEALPLPVAIFRLADARTLYANKWAAELLKMPLKTLHAGKSTDFVGDPGEVQRIVQSLRDGPGAIDHETMLHRGDGTAVPVRMSAILMEYEGQPAIMSVTEDITLRKQNEEQLELARQRAEEANLAKSSFLANMSHELRTPLNAVLGYAELMADGIYGALPEKAATVLGRIQTNGRHLLGLINDVLDLSKIEAGQAELHLESYSWAGIVHSTTSATDSLAEAKSIELRSNVPDALPFGRGDERRLTQVLMNLVGNAIKFTDEGYVEVSVRHDEDSFEIVVLDTGPGIAEKDQERIFDEFQQVDDTSTRKKGGTGLGLAISKRIVELHGGTISVVSKLGHGATFTIRLPVEVMAGEKETA